MKRSRSLFDSISSPRTPRKSSPGTFGSSPGTPRKRSLFGSSPETPTTRRSPRTPMSSPGTPVRVMGNTSCVSPETLDKLSKNDNYPRIPFNLLTARYRHPVEIIGALKLFWEENERQCEIEEALRSFKKKKRKC